MLVGKDAAEPQHTGGLLDGQHQRLRRHVESSEVHEQTDLHRCHFSRNPLPGGLPETEQYTAVKGSKPEKGQYERTKRGDQRHTVAPVSKVRTRLAVMGVEADRTIRKAVFDAAPPG